MINQELIESFGWKLSPEKAWMLGRDVYFRENYGLIFDSRQRYKNADYVYLWVRDPARHDTEVGSDTSILNGAFPWLGEATLHALNTLLPTTQSRI